MREMDHRIKNLFALASAVVSLSARSAAISEGIGADRERAPKCPCQGPCSYDVDSVADKIEQSAMLHELLRTILSPYDGETEDGQAPDFHFGR